MIHPIVKYGDPVLETPTKRVEKFDADFQKLVEDMFESMYAASGVGLAAPQIGLGLRVTVIDVSNGKNPEAKLVCANPEIIHAEGEQREEEGCLSVPGFRAHVARPQYVTIRAHDVTGKDSKCAEKIAGARVLPRNRSSQWCSVHHSLKHAETRHDQAQDSQAEKSRRVVGRRAAPNHFLRHP
jgi:peptide deformylase